MATSIVTHFQDPYHRSISRAYPIFNNTLAFKQASVSFFACFITILPIFGARDLELGISLSFAIWFSIAALLYSTQCHNVDRIGNPDFQPVTPTPSLDHLMSMLDSSDPPASPLQHHQPPPEMPSERDPTQFVDELVGAIRNLASDDNYKIVADVVSETLTLKETNARLAASHRDVLEEYRKFRNELEVTEEKLVNEKLGLQAVIENRDVKIEKLTARNVKLGEEVEKAKSRLDEESKKWVELVEVKNNLEKTVEELRTSVDEKSKLVGDVEEAKSKVHEELVAAKTSLQETGKDLVILKESKKSLSDQLNTAKASLDEKAGQLANAEKVKATVDSQLADMAAQLELKVKEAEDLAFAKEVLITELAGTTAKLEKNAKELDELTGVKASLDTELADAIASHEKKCKELDEVLRTKASLEADLFHAKIGLEDKTKEADELSSLLAEVGSKLDEKSKELEESFKVKAALDAQVTEVNARLDTEIANKATMAGEINGIKASVDQEIETSKAMMGEIAGLRQALEDSNHEIELLKGDVAHGEENMDKANSSIKELEIMVDKLQQELHTKTLRLDQIQGYHVQLRKEPEDHYVDILDKIWVSILDLVEKHFSTDLEAPVLHDASCWTNLRTSEYLKHAVRTPLPQSNSPSAKQMRIAAVLAVLSRALTKHIFRPTYLLDNDAELSQALRSLESADPAHELHIRSALLAALLPEREKRTAARRVKAVVREVSYTVQHLLSALQYEAFCTALEASCELACGQWRRIQTATMKIEPYFGPPYDDFDWQVLLLPDRFDGPPYGGAANASVLSFKSQHRHNDSGYASARRDDASVVADSVVTTVDPVDIMLVLWPSMCAVEGGELVSITQGLVMAKEQALAALEEEGRKRPGAKRARSMSVSKSVSVRGGSPKSVGSGGGTKSVKSVKSFLASVKSGIEGHSSNGSRGPQNGSAVDG